ncbi:M48 family metalloprotease [Shimia thalassica]|uniref:TPR repeat-containing protein YfgC n=1 Tax=Shimia thalassica TaxID=1715693 RepID=A0A0N7M8U7_9RHOB|nr:M48 family metalloprotease [Shimia thalassica]PHO03691.1 peptidase M48 [Rhodobacteraceae bacterium 4F10]MBU2942224.1 M48 family metalloprotease [Shimia thalassica]MDO6482757.1 M48 family metalloprotease [Shimia thalassica]MDO6502806.1 M48 family metalloprotease [Shimia thalassica]MDO6522589.1 M48 family metalloprotease [Shimia thalassica]
MRWIALVAAFSVVAACDTPTDTAPKPAPTTTKSTVSRLSVDQATKRLGPIKRRMEPIAESECRARTSGANCDFRISVDQRRDVPANAYQSVDSNGRPQITFTAALISDVQNDHELAFVMGHEAAHHIAGHLNRQQADAAAGALIVGVLAGLAGANAATLDAAMDAGALVGSRAYSKNYELEADRLGTVITKKSGYDPVRGAQYFTRIPDPGNVFLGTHPPNNQRIQTVRQTAAKM